MTIGFAMCGSFCTFSRVFPVMEALAKEHTVIPIFPIPPPRWIAVSARRRSIFAGPRPYAAVRC